MSGKPATLLHRTFEAANEIGDLTYAAYSCQQLNVNLLAVGDPLSEAQREAERGLAFARQARFGLVTDIIATQRRTDPDAAWLDASFWFLR